jgi:hypothetical protein
MKPSLLGQTDLGNHCAANVTGVSDLNADCLRAPEPARASTDDSTSESANDLNTALVAFGVPVRSKRAQAEAERRAKKKYAERWHKSLGGRQQVCNVRGYSTPPAAFNRPSVDDWAPTNRATRSLSDRAPFAYALSGYDPDRVQLEGYDAWTVP